MNNYKFGYSASDIGNMKQQLVKSVKSLSRFIDYEDIIIYNTPPFIKIDDVLSKCIVKNEDNITKKFRFYPKRYGRFGETFHCLKEKSDILFLMDCDIIFMNDPLKILGYKFDCAFRIGDAYNSLFFSDFIYNSMFRFYGKNDNVPMPNKGFMIFQNNTHNKIFYETIYRINHFLPFYPYLKGGYHKDQYAVALALVGYNFLIFGSDWHGYKWKNESSDCIAYHGKDLWTQN